MMRRTIQQGLVLVTGLVAALSAVSWAATVKVRPGSVAGYVFSPAGAYAGSASTSSTSSSSTSSTSSSTSSTSSTSSSTSSTSSTSSSSSTTSTTTTTLIAEKVSCVKFTLPGSTVTEEGTAVKRTQLSGLTFVGTGAVSGNKFTGVMHLEKCDVIPLAGTGSASIIGNNKCPAARNGGSTLGSTTYTTCPNSWASSQPLVYGKGAGACLLLTAANVAQNGPDNATYYAYAEVKDLDVTGVTVTPCP